jgi:hypothetical protein
MEQAGLTLTDKTHSSKVCFKRGSGMRRLLTLMLISVAALGLLACGKKSVWHRKITVIVSTLSGEVKGSSVQKETFTDNTGQWFASPEARGAGSWLSGEAVVVEVAPGRYLFALLGTNPATIPVLLPGEAPVKVAPNLSQLRNLSTLAASEYPALVTFTDINDPKSVKLVDPANLAATFGEGYNLKSITLEITDEGVTKGKTEQVLPWLKTVTSNLDGSKYSSPQLGLSNNINVGNFSTER